MSSCVSLVSLPLQKFCDVGFNDVELGRQCQARQLPVVLSEGLDGRDIVTLKDITLCPSKMQLCLCKSHKNSFVSVATVYLIKCILYENQIKDAQTKNLLNDSSHELLLIDS